MRRPEARRSRRLRRHGARLRRRRRALGAELLQAIFGVVLHALELHLELLVLMLQLLDGAGELAQRILDAVDAHGEVGAVGLRDWRLRRCWLLASLAAAPAARRG